jgi:ABC-type dipeptide/oligopeptide/nickel transport system ATPase component
MSSGRAVVVGASHAGAQLVTSLRQGGWSGEILLVGDEPLSALDVTVRAQIMELIRELRAAHRLTLVMVSHDIGVVQNLCDDVVVMTEGRVVEEGPTARVLDEPRADYTRTLVAAMPGRADLAAKETE